MKQAKERVIDLLCAITGELSDEQFDDLRSEIEELDGLIRELM